VSERESVLGQRAREEHIVALFVARVLDEHRDGGVGPGAVFRVQGSGFRAWGLGCEVCSLRVQGSGFWFSDVGFGGSRLRFWGLGCGVWDLRIKGSGLRVEVSGLRVWGVGFGAWGFGFRVWGVGSGGSGFRFRLQG